MYEMTVEFALEYIRRTICVGDYSLNFRHLVLQPAEQRDMQAHNEVLLLIEPTKDVKVESDHGLYDLTETLANEMQYEHTGDVRITNHSIFINHVRFIQVIPKNQKTLCQ